MKYIKLLSLLFITTISCLFASCEETAEVEEYANWEERNIAFIDSIAQVANANADGKWMRILSYKLNDTDKEGNSVEWDTDDYIYCHMEAEGTGTQHPLFTDTVKVNYRGRLIPSLSYPQGKVFDESYKGTFDPTINKPATFIVSSVIAGWGTALTHMTEGDNWRVYIPATLGYGSKEQTSIPAYSTLIFDINLAKIGN